MKQIRDRLMALVAMDAINGDSFERSVVNRQIREAIEYIDQQVGYIKRLEKEFLDLKMNCCFVIHAGGLSDDEIIEYKQKTAQAALAKIQEG